MRKVTGLLAVAAAAVLSGASYSSAAIVPFANFNVDEGDFDRHPTFSGSTNGLNTNSTADRNTVDGPAEGAGFQRLVLNDDISPGGTTRLRHVYNDGSAAAPVINTTAAADGWVGLAIRTSSAGWTVQLTLEGTETNSGLPKNITADGLWHVYEWNLDDQTGGPDGWGASAGVFGGDADFQDGNYTMDSLFFRHTNMPASATIDIDFVVNNEDGTVTSAIPEPGSLALLGLAGAAMIRRRRA